MDGISLEAASGERARIFTAENGHLGADEYVEPGCRDQKLGQHAQQRTEELERRTAADP